MNKPMMIVGAIVLVVILGAGFVMMNQAEQMPATDTAGGDAMMEKDHEGDKMEEKGDSMMEEGDLVEIEVEGGGFYFAPETITVKKGQTVRVVFNNVGGFHDFVIDEFDAATAQINGGETDTIEFVASEAGEFEYYCSVPGHREKGMFGTLIVEE